MRARAGSPRRWPSAASSAATPSSVLLANTPAMLECHYGVPMTRRRAQHAQHAARCRDHRLLARPCRGQGPDRRPRIFQGDEGGAGARQGEAAGHRLRRSGIFTAPASASARSNTRSFIAEGDPGFRLADARRRMGRDLAQLHLAAPPAIPRASSITTAAPICSRSAMSSPARMAKHPVYLWTLPMFHCNGWCFPWSISVVAGTHVCLRAGARARRCTTRSPSTRSRICAARRS